MNFIKTGKEAKKFIEDANKMFKNLRTVYENTELDEEQKTQDMEAILTEKGVELFSKKAFLGGDSLFDKIIQYNTDCAKLGKFNPLKSLIEHTVDKRIHYLADNPQFTFHLGKILQKVFEENEEISETEQPKEMISDVGIWNIREDSCPSKVPKEEYCGDGKKAQNERKRDQALCALQRGTFGDAEYPFMTCKSSNVCSVTRGGKNKTKGTKATKAKKATKTNKLGKATKTNARKKLTRKRKA